MTNIDDAIVCISQNIFVNPFSSTSHVFHLFIFLPSLFKLIGSASSFGKNLHNILQRKENKTVTYCLPKKCFVDENASRTLKSTLPHAIVAPGFFSKKKNSNNKW